MHGRRPIVRSSPRASRRYAVRCTSRRNAREPAAGSRSCRVECVLRETALPAATCASKRARLPPAAIHRKCAQDGVPLGYKGVSCSGDRWNSPLCEICSSVPHKFVRPPSTLPSQHDQHALVLERQALGRNRGAIHVRRITDSCQRVRAWRDRLAAWQSASQTFERAASGKSTSVLLRGRLWDLAI